jgi:hypothetical protein
MTLCPPCQELDDAWRDYEAPYTKWIQYERGATRSVESYHQKAQERRDLIRRQREGIAESCRRRHQTQDEMQEAA